MSASSAERGQRVAKGSGATIVTKLKKSLTKEDCLERASRAEGYADSVKDIEHQTMLLANAKGWRALAATLPSAAKRHL